MSKLAAIACIILSLAPVHAAEPLCSFPSGPVVVVDDGKRLLGTWEVADSPVWTSGLMPDSPGYWEFVRAVRSRMDVSSEEGYLTAPEFSKKEESEDYNARLMLKGGLGSLHPIDCLEALLLGVQASRRPMATEPTEFLAFVLRKEGRLKVWYYTVDQPGIGRLGPLKDAVEADAAEGWRPYLNIHNHNFFFDKDPAVAARPWPSAADAQLLRNLAIKGFSFQASVVTNGFLSSRLGPEALKRLRAAD